MMIRVFVIALSFALGAGISAYVLFGNIADLKAEYKVLTLTLSAKEEETERLQREALALTEESLTLKNKEREIEYREIEKEVYKYVTTSNPSVCYIDDKWVRVVNAATPKTRNYHNEIAGGSPGTNGGSGENEKVTMTELVGSVVSNYENCQVAIDRLEEWQDWYRRNKS